MQVIYMEWKQSRAQYWTSEHLTFLLNGLIYGCFNNFVRSHMEKGNQFLLSKEHVRPVKHDSFNNFIKT